jgi:hypothetical protein
METTAPPWVDLEGTYDHHYQVTAIDDLGNESAGSSPEIVTDAPDAMMPRGIARLGVAHPNPFNPSTTISFSVSQEGPVALEVFDLAGRHVQTLVSAVVSAGEHSVQWHGRDDTAAQVASGVYLYRLKAGDFVQTKRMVLLK